MIETYSDPAATPPLQSIDEDIRAGLPRDRRRQFAAGLVEDYYRGDNAKHIPRRPGEEDLDYQARPKLTSKITRRAVRVLAAPLYKGGPTRQLRDPAADAWLQKAYSAAKVNNRLAAANRSAILHGVAAIQVEATGRPNRPAKFWLWRSQEFAVYTVDGDPECPWAVVTRDTVPDRRGHVRARYRAWSAAEVRTYLSDPFGEEEPSLGREAPHLFAPESGPSPYPGVLPFCFVRNEPAECEFWGGGIGEALRQCNAEIDRELSDVAEHLLNFLNPHLFLRNVSVGTRFLDRIGQFKHLKGPAGADDEKTQPEAFALQVQLGVEAAWLNIKNYADATLEELDVPLTAVRSDASTDLSGVAITAKLVPLVEYTRERQSYMSEPEADLAALTLAVCGTHDTLRGGTEGAALQGAAAEPGGGLACIWPEPSIPQPTPERDQQDEYELSEGLTDHIEVYAKRRGLTLDEAERQMAETAARERRYQALMGDVLPRLQAQQAAIDTTTTTTHGGDGNGQDQGDGGRPGSDGPDDGDGDE